MTTADDPIRCLTEGRDCGGAVEWHSTDPGFRPAFPRCEAHWAARLESRESSMERYADSDVAPDWFDPSFAGETW